MENSFNVKIQQTSQNLLNVTDIMHSSLIKMSERGTSINELEIKSEELLDSSNQFISFFDPWYIRIWKNVSCCYRSWWFQFPQEEDKLHILPWVKVSD